MNDATLAEVVTLLAALANLGGCARVLPPEAFIDGRPEMRPEGFFSGATSSTGILENASGAPTERLRVEGHGRAAPNDGFRLDQTITIGSEPSTTRTWFLRRVDEHRYTGTLSDASGPVEAQAYGNLFHLTYAMKRPVAGRMEQWLYLQPDGRTVVNNATIRVLGLVVAQISERITRTAP